MEDHKLSNEPAIPVSLPSSWWVIGIDAADWKYIDRLMDRGGMPVLKNLLSRGARASLKTVIPPFSAPAWTSFSTGCLPGKHGIFDFIQSVPGTYDVRTTRGGERGAIPLWKILDAEGMATVVVNLPMTYPPDATERGCMISGLDAPSEGSHITHPPELWQAVSARGDYRIYPAPKGRTISQYADDMWKVMELRADVFLDLALERKPRLGILVFETIDMMGHLCLGPDEDADGAFMNLFYRSYEKADAILGKIIDRLPPGTGLMLVSDHGMRPLKKFVLLDQWLIDNCFLSMKEGASGASNKLGGAAMKIARGCLSAANRFVPGGIRKKFGKFKQVKNRMEASLWNMSVDWSSTLAFTCNMQGIYINLEGRYPNGCVKENDAPALLAAITEKLMALNDPETGERVVENILPRDKTFSGPASHIAPDLYILWKKGYEGQLRRQGEMFCPPLRWPDDKLLPADCRDIWRGDHSESGIFVASGPGIKEGADIGEASLQDVAPTLLASMGLPVPGRMDGNVIQGIFTSPPETEITGTDDNYDSGPVEFSQEEEEARRERLRNLGYLS